jgi:outer membrane lipoprotein-sorting protein
VTPLLLLALSSFASAATVPRYTAPQVFDEMLKAQAAQGSYRAEIVKREGPIGASPTAVSKGVLRVAPGGKARLDISEPSPGVIASDGKRLWVELTEVGQVMSYDAAKLREGGNFFLDLPSSIRHYAKASQRRLIVPGPGFDPDKVSALELLPLHPQEAGFQRLQVWVDEERWVVLRVLLDYGGTRSDVRFGSIQTGAKAPVDETLFHYKPPKGFEVFDLD